MMDYSRNAWSHGAYTGPMYQDTHLAELKRAVHTDALEIFDRMFPKPSTLPPEKRLMLALLERTIDDLRGVNKMQCGKRTADDARAWVMSTEADYPFSFENVCDELGLDPGAVRRHLLALKPAETWARPPRLRKGDQGHRWHGPECAYCRERMQDGREREAPGERNPLDRR